MGQTDSVPLTPRGTRADLAALLISGTPLIDVRAPVEYARGAFPAAINLPLMNDEERHSVGVRYKESGQDSAIALGAELVDGEPRQLRTRAWHDYAQLHPGGALYCFRGGLRSRIAQAWLAESGIDWPLVKGGYKALRQCCLDALYTLPSRLPLIVLGGRTGTGKTDFLLKLDRFVDLEGRAQHRGSSFGATVAPQPTPINFENAIAIDLMRLHVVDAQRAVWLEDEAKLIGRICLPDNLREAMLRAPSVVLETSIDERARNCTQDYVIDLLARYQGLHGVDDGFERFAAHHRDSLLRIRKRFGGERYAAALQLLEHALAVHRAHRDVSAYAPFIEMLLTEYYDPMYDYQLANKKRRVLARGDQAELMAFARDYQS